MPLVDTGEVSAFFSFTSRSMSRRRFLASDVGVLLSFMLLPFLIESRVELDESSSELFKLWDAEDTARLYGGGPVDACEAEDKVLRVSEVCNIAFAAAEGLVCDVSRRDRDATVSEVLLMAGLRIAPCGSDDELVRD